MDKDTTADKELFEKHGIDKQPIPRVDDAALEIKARAFPEDLREPFIFLGVYFRTNCGKDFDLLVDAFKRVGVYRTKETWAKLLRGQWRRDSRGEERANPLVNEENLADDLEALRSNVRLETLKGKVGFIETPTSRDIFDFLQEKWRPEMINKWGFVIGPTGSQKTASFKEFTRRNNHGMCRWMEAPENGSMFEFLKHLSYICGQGSNDSGAQKRSGILRCFNEKRMLIVDNGQELLKDGEVEQRAFSFLRRLQDETGCTVVVSLTPSYEAKLINGNMAAYFEQLIGRAGGTRKFLRLPEYAPEEDVLAFGTGFELQEVKKHVKELVKISREPGRIRILCGDLQEGKKLASTAGEKFTIEHVRDARGEA
jgi:DNA transposition AAA+ family ATPase